MIYSNFRCFVMSISNKTIVLLSILIGTSLILLIHMNFDLNSYWNLKLSTRLPSKDNALQSLIQTHNFQVDLQPTVVRKTDFQVIEPYLAYVYSAYIDNRPARESWNAATQPVVRIYAYHLRGANTTSWKCLFWDEPEMTTPTVVDVHGTIDLDEYITHTRYSTVMLLCQLPVMSLSIPPHAVSVVTSNGTYNATNYIPLVDIRTEQLNFSNNNISITNFTVCVTPIFGNYSKVSEIVEFIEVGRMFGAEKFILYIRDVSDEMYSCLMSYVERGVVELGFWTPAHSDFWDIHHYGEIITVQDCLYHSMYRTRYLAVYDLDEMIVPTSAETWQEMLNNIHSQPRMDKQKIAQIGAYRFRNLLFCIETKNDATFEKNSFVQIHHLRTLLNTCRDKDILGNGIKSKILARPELIMLWRLHYIRDFVGRRDLNYDVNEDHGLVFHYRNYTCHPSPTPHRRLHKYSNEIISRVNYSLSRIRH